VIASRSEELLGNKIPVSIPGVSRPNTRFQSFITRRELNQIQSDIEVIISPSWIEKLRPTFGEKSNGRVKAAEWRSLFTVYLPMTLLRLWGIEMSRSFATDHILHLKALLSLTLVVYITTSTSISKATMTLYDNCIEFYLRLISALNEDVSPVINHHLSLHLSDFMRLHGPCRSHWAFPFERLIGTIQKIPHNSHIGWYLIYLI
jgi:hypothetical protein